MNPKSIIHQGALLLLDPLLLFWLIVLIGLYFYFRRSKKIGHRIVGCALFWLFLISTSPVPVYFAKQLESRYPILWQIPNELKTPKILILGAGHSNAATLPPNDQLSKKALSRLSEGIRLKQQSEGAILIGSGNSMSKRTPQATVLMNTAVALGISPADTLQNTQPFNTETESIAFAERFGTGEPLILVTSALHMPRAVFWFQQKDVQVIPATTDHYVKPGQEKSPYNWKPSATKIEITAALLHEWVGIMVGKVKVFSGARAAEES